MNFRNWFSGKQLGTQIPPNAKQFPIKIDRAKVLRSITIGFSNFPILKNISIPAYMTFELAKPLTLKGVAHLSKGRSMWEADGNAAEIVDYFNKNGWFWTMWGSPGSYPNAILSIVAPEAKPV